MYFDQRMGALHAVRWSKSIFYAKTTFCVLLSHKMYKITQKITKNPGFKGVYQRLGVTLKRWLTPKSWSTPEQNLIF